MFPPSWKTEIKKTIEEATDRQNDKRETSETQEKSTITNQISALVNHFESEQRREQRDRTIKVWVDSLTLFFVFLTATFTGLAWWVFKDQLHEMKEVYGPIKTQAEAAKISAAVAQNTLIATQRPWLKLNTPTIESPLIFNAAGGQITFKFVLKNKGNTPATNVRIQPKIYLHNFGRNVPPPSKERPFTREDTETFDTMAMLQKMCRDQGIIGASVRKADYLLGDTVFPDDEWSQAIAMKIENTEINSATEGRADKIIFPFLLVCVDYGFPFSETNRQTGLSFVLTYADATKNIAASIGRIPAGELVMMPEPFRSGLAN